MKPFGRHLILELAECKIDLNNINKIKKILLQAVKISNAKIEKVISKKFYPQGFSLIYVLSESHLSIHVYPEENYCQLDFFTCGKKANPFKCLFFLKNYFESKKYKYKKIIRGRINKNIFIKNLLSKRRV